jgi:RNA polymerase sigma-70 factor, ECF subfamily
LGEGKSQAMSTWVQAIDASTATGERDTAFAALVEQAQRRVFQIAYSVLGNAADAEEVAQDAFLRAYRRLGDLRDPEKFRAWVSRIAFRLALNRRRAQGRRLARDTAWHAACPVPELDGARSEAGRLFLERVRREVARLPEKLRAVLLLSAADGMEAGEVAAILGIPAGTVRSRLHLARKRLLEALE